MQSPDSATIPAGNRQPLVHSVALVAGVLLAVAVCVLLWLRLLPLGIPGQWEWPWRVPPQSPGLPAIAGFVLLVAAAVYIVFLINSRSPRSDQYFIAVLLCCICAGVLLGGLFVSQSIPMIRTATATTSIAALPYYGEAVQARTLPRLFGRYGHSEGPSTRPDRLRTHPPGPVVYYLYARRVILSRPALLEVGERLFAHEGVSPETALRFAKQYTIVPLTEEDVIAGTLASLFISLLGALLPAAVFLLVLAVWDTRVALAAAVVSASIPSLVLFVPSIDGAGAIMAISALAAFLWSRRQKRPSLAALSGLLWAAAGFWSVGLLVVAFPAVIAVIRDVVHADTGRQGLVIAGTALGVFVLLFVALFVFCGYRPVANLQEIFRSQAFIMSRSARDRLPWTLMNMYEFALFFGPALLTVSVTGLVSALRGPFRPAVRFLGWGLIAAFVLLVISGTTRGEVGRIWLFLMPMLSAFAAVPVIQMPKRHRWWYLPVLAAAQGLCCLVMYAFIIPVRA
ncbi:MAG: hypothetical protein ACLFWB_00890 [Armatimonadota bacterium]